MDANTGLEIEKEPGVSDVAQEDGHLLDISLLVSCYMMGGSKTDRARGNLLKCGER